MQNVTSERYMVSFFFFVSEDMNDGGSLTKLFYLKNRFLLIICNTESDSHSD